MNKKKGHCGGEKDKKLQGAELLWLTLKRSLEGDKCEWEVLFLKNINDSSALGVERMIIRFHCKIFNVFIQIPNIFLTYIFKNQLFL